MLKTQNKHGQWQPTWIVIVSMDTMDNKSNPVGSSYAALLSWIRITTVTGVQGKDTEKTSVCIIN